MEPWEPPPRGNHGGPDVASAAVARDFIAQLAQRRPVFGALMFGSRARGDWHEESDVDVAVLLDEPRGKFVKTKLDMGDLAHEIFLETDVHLQISPVWRDELENPDITDNPELIAAIKRDGVNLLALPASII